MDVDLRLVTIPSSLYPYSLSFVKMPVRDLFFSMFALILFCISFCLDLFCDLESVSSCCLFLSLEIFLSISVFFAATFDCCCKTVVSLESRFLIFLSLVYFCLFNLETFSLTFSSYLSTAP
jgi:hypothetical protein